MSSALSKHKVILRSKMRKKIRTLGPISLKKKSRLILKRVLASDFYRQAVSVLIYVSFKKEVETAALIRKSLKDGKKVFVPHLEGRVMKAFRVRNLAKDLKQGPYGVSQPHKPGRAAKPSGFDIIFVPGLAFDENGGRLGRGAGYFDRYLAKAKRALKIGLAFKEQVVKKVPLEKHDVRMDFIITD